MSRLDFCPSPTVRFASDNGGVTQLTGTARRTFRPGVGLGYVGGFAAGGLALSALYATTGLAIRCPFRALTGWDCPFCGATRMGAALLHGELAAGFGFNPLAFLVVTVLGLLAVVWLIELLGGPQVRLPLGLSAWLRRVAPAAWVVVSAAVAVAFMVVRNLL